MISLLSLFYKNDWPKSTTMILKNNDVKKAEQNWRVAKYSGNMLWNTPLLAKISFFPFISCTINHCFVSLKLVICLSGNNTNIWVVIKYYHKLGDLKQEKSNVSQLWRLEVQNKIAILSLKPVGISFLFLVIN